MRGGLSSHAVFFQPDISSSLAVIGRCNFVAVCLLVSLFGRLLVCASVGSCTLDTCCLPGCVWFLCCLYALCCEIVCVCVLVLVSDEVYTSAPFFTLPCSAAPFARLTACLQTRPLEPLTSKRTCVWLKTHGTEKSCLPSTFSPTW